MNSKRNRTSDIKALDRQAMSFHYSDSVPLKKWVHTTRSILRHAERYSYDKVDQQAYILYERFILLMTTHIPNHPELDHYKTIYNTDPNSSEAETYKEYLQMQSVISEVTSKRDELKSRLNDKAIRPKKVSPLNKLKNKLKELSPNERKLLDMIHSINEETPLRPLLLSPKLVEKFMFKARRNTQCGLETCGILCGKLKYDTFFVTCVVIPKQVSTRDTCSEIDEEHTFKVIDKLKLFVLGWIHIHPTQSCFLSSIDLHSQNSYQLMLDEAIAIVCAPNRRFDEHIGIFHLTNPNGMHIIGSCKKNGFHAHREDNLYVNCKCGPANTMDGHVFLLDNIPFKCKDLR